jgi:hypothetical protein
MLSALYPGAGTDIFPVVMFRNIKQWRCMDSQPNSEFGDQIFPGLERPRFLTQLKQIMSQNDFELQVIDGDDYIFYNKEYDQTIYYETNSVFPRDLEQRHYDCDYAVLCGFDMGDKTIDFINRFQNIITNNITCFELNEKQLLLSKNVSTLIIDTEWDYWEQDNQISHLIEQHVKINL